MRLCVSDGVKHARSGIPRAEIKQIFTDGTGLAMKPPYGQVIKD